MTLLTSVLSHCGANPPGHRAAAALMQWVLDALPDPPKVLSCIAWVLCELITHLFNIHGFVNGHQRLVDELISTVNLLLPGSPFGIGDDEDELTHDDLFHVIAGILAAPASQTPHRPPRHRRRLGDMDISSDETLEWF